MLAVQMIMMQQQQRGLNNKISAIHCIHSYWTFDFVEKNVYKNVIVLMVFMKNVVKIITRTTITDDSVARWVCKSGLLWMVLQWVFVSDEMYEGVLSALL